MDDFTHVFKRERMSAAMAITAVAIMCACPFLMMSDSSDAEVKEYRAFYTWGEHYPESIYTAEGQTATFFSIDGQVFDWTLDVEKTKETAAEMYLHGRGDYFSTSIREYIAYLEVKIADTSEPIKNREIDQEKLDGIYARFASVDSLTISNGTFTQPDYDVFFTSSKIESAVSYAIDGKAPIVIASTPGSKVTCLGPKDIEGLDGKEVESWTIDVEKTKKAAGEWYFFLKLGLEKSGRSAESWLEEINYVINDPALLAYNPQALEMLDGYNELLAEVDALVLEPGKEFTMPEYGVYVTGTTSGNPSDDSNLLYIGVGAVAVIIVAALAFVVIRSRR